MSARLEIKAKGFFTSWVVCSEVCDRICLEHHWFLFLLNHFAFIYLKKKNKKENVCKCEAWVVLKIIKKNNVV